MKSFQVVLCLLLVSAGARASDRMRDEEPKLREGNWRVGASLSLTGNSMSNGDSSFLVSASLPLQYFLVDGFSAGLAIDWTTVHTSTSAGGSQTTTIVSMGAEATWYFWRHKGLAAFIEPEFFVNTRDGGPTTYSAAGALGLQLFLNSSVAIGPGVLYAHEFGTGNVPNTDSYRFFIQLFIYL
jgi:hypothetical protein